MKFNLTKYPLKANTVYPYFKTINNNNEYFVYEGAIGNNRFQYFKVLKNSKAGKLCNEYNEKYIVKNEKRNVEAYVLLQDKLIKACKNEATEKLTGLDAYSKYWHACITKEDKIKFLKIYIIPNFEALKDWYNVKLENYIEEIGNDCLSKTVKNVEIEKFKNNIISEVENHLQTNANNKFTGISSLHAEQLIKFYDWLQPQNNSAMEQQLQKEIKPIWWQGTGRQLGYLLDELAAKGFIDKNTNFNEAIKTHFVDKDKNPFTNSIKQNKSGTQHNTKSGGKPKGANQLDEIITAISKK